MKTRNQWFKKRGAEHLKSSVFSREDILAIQEDAIKSLAAIFKKQRLAYEKKRLFAAALGVKQCEALIKVELDKLTNEADNIEALKRWGR